MLRTATAAVWLCVVATVSLSSASIAVAAPASEIYLQGDASFEASEVLLAGSATDAGGISAVTVAVQNRGSGLWLQANGAWAAGPARLGANLSTPGAATTRWLFRKSLPVGVYSVNAAATSTGGVTQDAGSRVTRQFSVLADRANLDPAARWLTIHFGRTNWGVAGQGGAACATYDNPVNGTVFLDEVAALLSDHDYRAEGSVPFGQFDPDPAVRRCPWRGVMSASLNDLGMLRDTWGWTFVADSIGPVPSDPSDRPSIETLSCTDKITTASASLAELARSGHRRAWGLFADPGNSVTTATSSEVTSRLYSFTRKYGSNLAQNQLTQAKALAGDWARFKSVVGGRCADASAPCYNHQVAGDPGNTLYEQPDYLFPYMIATPGAWRGIQFYRFVRGANLPGGYPGTPTAPAGSSRESYWDCTSPNPARHWTSRAEIYCYADFVHLVERLYAEYPDVVTADTAHVATTWGVGNPNHRATFPACSANAVPVASAVSIGGAPQVGQSLAGSYTYTDAESDPEGPSEFRWLRNGSTAIPEATARTYTVTPTDSGATLVFEVTPVAQRGTSVGAPVRSAPTAAVTGSNRAPTVSITSPANGGQYAAGSAIPLTADTADPDGDAVTVTWTANGNAIAPPWGPPAGSYTVQATARDAKGAEARTSAAISVVAPALSGRANDLWLAWSATVRYTAPAGSSVSGTWSSSRSTGGCTVAANATSCEFTSGWISRFTSSVKFTATTGASVVIGRP
jgi:hypothetical protein